MTWTKDYKESCHLSDVTVDSCQCTFIAADVEYREVGELVYGGRHRAQAVTGHIQHRQQRKQQPLLHTAPGALQHALLQLAGRCY